MNDTNVNTPPETVDPTVAPPAGPTVEDFDALRTELESAKAAVDAHTDQLRENDTRVSELEQEVDTLGSQLRQLQSTLNHDAARNTGPAPDGTTPNSLAANDDGLQPGHAGLGTGDGPAGYRS